MTSRIWRRSEATHERVVLGASRARVSVERPTLVPPPSGELATSPALTAQQRGHIEALEEQLRKLKRENADLKDQLSGLHSDLQAARGKAEERGYEAGMANAENEIGRRIGQHAAAWKSATEEMLRTNDTRFQALRAEISDIVLAAVAKIIGEQLANPNLIRASTEQLLKESGAGAPVRVLLSPLQHDQLTKAGGGQLAWFRDRRLEISADERVQYGGCLLETAQGIIDGRFEVQLEKLRQVLTPHYGAGR